MPIAIFKQEIVVDKNIHEIIDFMDKVTFRPKSVLITPNSFVKGYEFRGSVWTDGFCVIRDSDFRSSVAPEAEAHIVPVTETQSKVYLKIGPNEFCTFDFSFHSCGFILLYFQGFSDRGAFYIGTNNQRSIHRILVLHNIVYHSCHFQSLFYTNIIEPIALA